MTKENENLTSLLEEDVQMNNITELENKELDSSEHYVIEERNVPNNFGADPPVNNVTPVKLTAEIKAQIIFDNFVKGSGRVFSGKEKRSLYRECLRNAKRGKYDYMFDPEKIRKKEERDKVKFDKLNAPMKHTVEEIPTDVKESLLEMVDKEPWPTK